MNEAREEDDCERGAIVFNEYSDVMLEERALANETADVSDHQDEKRDYNREVEAFFSLASEDLDSFLEVDERYVEAEYIA